MNTLIKNMKPFGWVSVVADFILALIGAAAICLVSFFSLTSFLMYTLTLFVIL